MQTLLEKHIHAKSVRKVLEMTSENSSFSLENPDMQRPRNHCGYGVLGGGEREIRTLGTFDSSHDFQSCALDQLSHLSMTIVSITACVMCKPALKLYLLWEQLSMLFFDVDYL